jgi:hypothetical protein
MFDPALVHVLFDSQKKPSAVSFQLLVDLTDG